jgi:hypothetical protein
VRNASGPSVYRELGDLLAVRSQFCLRFIDLSRLRTRLTARQSRRARQSLLPRCAAGRTATQKALGSEQPKALLTSKSRDAAMGHLAHNRPSVLGG